MSLPAGLTVEDLGQVRGWWRYVLWRQLRDAAQGILDTSTDPLDTLHLDAPPVVLAASRGMVAGRNVYLRCGGDPMLDPPPAAGAPDSDLPIDPVSALWAPGSAQRWYCDRARARTGAHTSVLVRAVVDLDAGGRELRNLLGLTFDTLPEAWSVILTRLEIAGPGWLLPVA